MNKQVVLREIASARSGDKGNHANIGVIAIHEAAYNYLLQHLTEDRVKAFFRDLGVTRVKRYELPNVWAFNFLLFDALAGGASQSLRLDTQGKLLGTRLLGMTMTIKETELESLRSPQAAGPSSGSNVSRK